MQRKQTEQPQTTCGTAWNTASCAALVAAPRWATICAAIVAASASSSTWAGASSSACVG